MLPAAGLTVTDGAGRTLGLTAPATYVARPRRRAGQHLQRYVAGNWYGVAVGGATKLDEPGALHRHRQPDLGRLPVASTRVTTAGFVASCARAVPAPVINVDTLSMEDYLRGVVPQEASPSWYPAALQAQAIAARTYAAQQRGRPAIWSIVRHL